MATHFQAPMEAAAELAASGAGLRLTHQTGERDVEMVRAAYRAAGLQADVEPFLYDMGRRIAEADMPAPETKLGRSLGVHLLLASQRLEEGRLRGLDTHLSYRIGLRTFSESESSTILETKDAFHLPPVPGFGLYFPADAS